MSVSRFPQELTVSTISESTNAPAATIDIPIPAATPVVEERRESTRIQDKLAGQLVGLGCTRAVSCSIQNMAEGGIYVHVPADSGVGVGCRYELILDDEETPPMLAGAMVGGCYATVVRTELLLDRPERMLGAGLRFDQPLML
jgi:hypothetical protein